MWVCSGAESGKDSSASGRIQCEPSFPPSTDAGISSFFHGKTKPHEAIFLRMLELLDVAAADAAMVGDTIEDDVEGARAVGMTAVLVDRDARHPGFPGRIDDLRALPVVLGLD